MFIHNSAISSPSAPAAFIPRWHDGVVAPAVKRWWQKTESHMGTIAQSRSLSPAAALYHRNYQLIHFAHAPLHRRHWQ